MYIFIIEQKQLFMNLVIIVLVAALIIGIAIIANRKSKVEEILEPLVNPNFKLDLEDPVAPVEAPQEVVPEVIEELKKVVKKAAKAPAKTSAKPAPKKTVTNKSK